MFLFHYVVIKKPQNVQVAVSGDVDGMFLPNLGKGRKAEQVVRVFVQSILRYLGFGFPLLVLGLLV